MTIPDYVAVAVLIMLMLWAVAGLSRGKFELWRVECDDPMTQLAPKSWAVKPLFGISFPDPFILR